MTEKLSGSFVRAFEHYEILSISAEIFEKMIPKAEIALEEKSRIIKRREFTYCKEGTVRACYGAESMDSQLTIWETAHDHVKAIHDQHQG